MPTPRGSVVVTGASSGIGRACALHLDGAGYRVFATVRKPADADALAATASPNLVPVLLDVTDEASVATAARAVGAAVGAAGLAGLVNNAGYGVPGPIELVAPADLRRQLEVNVVGQMVVTQAFLPLVRTARGRIVNIGSVGGKITIPFGGALCASKYAIEAITDALRMELHPWGIHVVLVAPAGIATPAVDALQRDGEAAIATYPPEGRRRYEAMFRTFLQRAVAKEKKGSPPAVVARAVLTALTARTPKARYPVGADAIPLTWLPWLLPPRWLDRLRFRMFGLPPRFSGTAD
ncbi:short-chain dehydrogenase : Oxidoreductase, Glucose/ribitol dehydrogenase family OS=Candidatus Nitrospira defluvii GN=NIDE3609 PE=3 SV=1: adh_short [Gemmataceae bacterium]|nr:short-chain dehydrogenase : Oxidoreductase, Glucose/ribitol dehydrogenase family OS=Candidatus Nitrospira defluvii GN=NIDE3609 PE=3 SV=1: adh_short [Gemmataceae bacterium]VTU00890.1 short-chain dehydrogenase : Oxidoreductase, Glucose/ribitol dehydrogenase family OS=Candidatus Nitrospira defluvii GN=NIDE3609 PE=3 SV=1: adh_short [Gemmataceae bacterium]